MSGRYEIGPQALNYRDGVRDMAAVWHDHRGDGVLVGVTSTVGNLHPELRENYDDGCLRHHDPQDETAGSSPLGTAMAGVVAAEDIGRGLAGTARDARVFQFTGDRREAPDILVMEGKRLPHGDQTGGTLFRHEGARGGLGRIVIAETPGGEGDDHRDTRCCGFRDDPIGGPLHAQAAVGWTNARYDFRADRPIITTDATTMWGHFAHLSGVQGMMTLVGAPNGTAAYWGVHDPGTQWWNHRLPDHDPGHVDWTMDPGVAHTLVLDHRGEFGRQQSDEPLDNYWQTIAEHALGVQIDRPGDYTVAYGGGLASSVVGGAVALMLDANPNFGWRDVQAILAHAANPPATGYAPTFDELAWGEARAWWGAGGRPGTAAG